MAVWDDAVFLWNPGDASNPSFDIVTTVQAAGITEGSVVTHLGRTGRSYVGAVASRFASPVANLSAAFSSFVVSRFTTTGVVQAITLVDSADSDRWHRLAPARGSLGEVDIRSNLTSTPGEANWPYIQIPDVGANDDFHITISTFDGSTLTAYLDTDVAAGSDTFSGGNVSSIDRLSIGRLEDSSPSNSVGGEVYAAGFWTRAITATEIDEILADPFAYLLTLVAVRVTRAQIETLIQDPAPPIRASRVVTEFLVRPRFPSSGQSTVTGSLTVIGTHQLTGSTSGATSLTADAIQTHNLVASSSGATSVSAVLENVGINALVASVAGVTTVSGSLDVITTLDVASSGMTSVVVTLDVLAELDGSTSGSTTVTGFLNVIALLIGSVSGVTTTTADADQVHNLTGSSAGSTLVTSSLQNIGTNQLLATVTGMSSISATLDVITRLVATSTGATVLSASVKSAIQLSGTATGVTVITAQLILVHELEATPAGVTTLDITLFNRGPVTLGRVAVSEAVVGGLALLASRVNSSVLAAASVGGATQGAESVGDSALTGSSVGSSTLSES